MFVCFSLYFEDMNRLNGITAVVLFYSYSSVSASIQTQVSVSDRNGKKQTLKIQLEDFFGQLGNECLCPKVPAALAHEPL